MIWRDATLFDKDLFPLKSQKILRKIVNCASSPATITSSHDKYQESLEQTPLSFNWISRHLVNESPFWWMGHGSSFVVDASVVFQRIPSEYSLLHLFCSVYGRKKSNIAVISHSVKKGIEKITFMLKNLYESACLTAIYLIFLQNINKKWLFCK